MLSLTPAFLAAQQEPVRRYGLFVGANNGGIERVLLRWAVSDAQRMADIMTEAGGIQLRDAYVLQDPRGEDLSMQFEHIASRIAIDRQSVARTEVVFYYSGHSDETGLMLGEDHMTYGALREAIDSVGADVSIAILDSCASGAFTRIKGGSFSEPLLPPDGSDITGHAFLSSSSADEASQESDTLRSSFFTHYLVSGLRGAADSSEDRIVTLEEAYTYAREQTLQRTINSLAGPQTASFDFQLSGTGSLVLTNLTVVDAGVELESSISGHLYVTGERGIVAEVDKVEGAPLRLALPAGEYTLTLQGEARNYEHSVVLASGTVRNVRSSDFRVTFLDRNRVRGNSQPSSPVSVSLLPGSDLTNQDTAPYVNLSAGAVVADAYRVEGGQFASIYSETDEDLTGVQFSGVGNRVGGNLLGYQGAGVFNVVMGSSAAVQVSGVFNEIEGVGSIAQAAGVFNLAAGGFNGAQSAGVFNISRGTVNGAQIAGVFNQTDSLNGAQIGLVNIGNGVTGAQIGLVNIGGTVTGAQIGLVNISDQMYGVPFGLVSVVRNGIQNVSAWWEGESKTYLGVQNGSNFFYTLAFLGFDRGGAWQEIEGLSVGAGAGVRITNRPFYFDVDVSVMRVSDGSDSQQRFASLFQPTAGAVFPVARIMAGAAIGDGLGWFMGGTFKLEGGIGYDSMGFFSGSNPDAFSISGGTTLRVHPVFITGFRF